MRKGNVPLANVIEWGQGYDDTVVELLQSLKKFRDGYYELINYGDDWWRNFNQGVEFNEIMQEQWGKIEKIDFMTILDKMAIATAGAYIDFDKFVDGVLDAYENGNGFRHKEGGDKDADSN